MLPNIPTNAITAELDPLIISSPTIRSGTTLLQRLLCSSNKALIYGELCAQDLVFFVNLYALKVQEYNYHRQRFVDDLERVLRGDVDDWIWNLMPDIDGYLVAISQAAFAGIKYSQDYAAQIGRPIWGFKYPGLKPSIVRLLRTVMPKSRFIFIYRDIVACLRSAKAQQSVYSTQEVHEFCQSWIEGVEYIRSLENDPAMLVLSYEELMSEPVVALERIAHFSGLTDMNPSVLNRKINAWTGKDYLSQAIDGYTPPAELSEVEMQIINNRTSELRASLYTGAIA